MELQWRIILQIIQRVCVSYVYRDHSLLSTYKSHLHCYKYLCCYLSCQACTDPETLKSCRDWLKGSVLGEHLLGLTEELCNVRCSSPSSTSSTSNHSWTLISLVLSQHHNNGKDTHSHTPAIFFPSGTVFFVELLMRIMSEFPYNNHFDLFVLAQSL